MISKIFNSRKISLILFAVFFIFSTSSAYGQVVIEVLVKDVDGQPLAGANVVLQKIIMAETPQVELAGKGDSDANGVVRFEIPKPDKKSFFRLESYHASNVAGSDPFRANEPLVKKNLQFPALINDTSSLRFPKQIILYEPTGETVRISQVLIVENSSLGMIDIRDKPIILNLPAEAENMMSDQGSSFILEFEGQKAIAKSLIPQGQHRIFFSYTVPLDVAKRMTIDIVPNVVEFESIMTEAGLSADFITSGKEITNINKSEKEYRGQVYVRQSFLIPDGTKKIDLKMMGLPMEQKILFYPAVILFVFMISGLFWYLKAKPHPMRS